MTASQRTVPASQRTADASQRTAERQEILQQTRIVWRRCLEMARRNYVNPSDRGFEAQVAQFLANLGPVKTARRMRQHIVYTRPCSLSSTRT